MFLTQAEVVQRFDDTNEAFMAADRATRRKMLAEDVLVQLRAQTIKAAHTYIMADFVNTDLFGWESADLKTQLRGATWCHVCMIGAFFVSAVHRLNDIKVDQIDDRSLAVRSNMVAYMTKYELFTRPEARAMEEFFESGSTFFEHPRYSRYCGMDTSSRMRHAAELIIASEGKEEITLDFLMPKTKEQVDAHQ